MNWQVATGIMIAANVATSLIQRRYSQKSKSPATFPPAASYLLGVMPIGLFVGFVLMPHNIDWSGWLVTLLLIQGVSMAISGWAGFKASGQMGVTPFQTISRFTQVVVIALGWTLLSEGLTTLQFIGATIILIASLLAIWAPKNTIKNRKTHYSSILLALISATFLGVGLVTEKAMLHHMDIGGIYLVAWGTQTLSMLVLASKDFSRANLRNFLGYEVKQSALMGLANGFSGVFYVYAILHADNISLVQSLGAVALPLTVLGAFIFLKERESQKLLLFSLVLSFAGLVLISL